MFVDDNFHYMDEEHRYLLGEYETLEAACRRVVDRCLEDTYQPGLTAAELSALYALYGDDPFIMESGHFLRSGTMPVERVEEIAKEPNYPLAKLRYGQEE